MDFSRIQDFDMQLLHVFNGSENVWLDQMAMALTSGWTWIPLYIVLFVVVIRNNEMMGQIALVVGGAVLCIFLADGLVDGIIGSCGQYAFVSYLLLVAYPQQTGYVDPVIMVARKLLDPSLPGCSLSGRHSLRSGYRSCGGSCRLSYLHQDVLPHLPKD